MRRFAPTSPEGIAATALVRAPTAADVESLARLLLVAYRGTMDDEGETLEDSRAVVRQLFAGEFGAMAWSISELTEWVDSHAAAAGRPVAIAATLCTRFEERPFVAFSVTDPLFQRPGLARAGLVRAFGRLADAGESVLRLVVTRGNGRAERLYASLGFEPEQR